jgi:L-fucose isomerase-like protein
LETFGHGAVVYTPNLQKLLAYLCKNGFEHHVAMTMGNVSNALDEAFTNYMGWENYKLCWLLHSLFFCKFKQKFSQALPADGPFPK